MHSFGNYTYCDLCIITIELTEDVVDDAFSDILLHKILLGLVLHTAALLFSAALRRPLRSIDIDILGVD